MEPMLRRVHDMGGEAAGPVEPARDEHDHAPWEKKVDAIFRILAGKSMITTDELRRGIEELGPGAYDQLAYYERWIGSITNNLLEKGVLTPAELGQAIAAAERAHAEAGA
jgi:hypothetical protein